MEVLKKLRKSRDLTQAELSEILNVSPSAIGMYEQGRRMPDKETLLAIAKYFDVSTDYLLGHTPSVKVYPSDNAPPKEVTPIDSLVAELFADNPNVLSLLQGSEIFARPLEGENLTNITAEQKETIKNALLLGLRAAGLKVD